MRGFYCELSTMTGVNFVLTKFGGKQGFPLLVPSVLLIVQTLLFSTSALPAKSGPSSKSLEYAGLPVSYSQVENNKNSLEPKDTSVIPNGPFKITVYPWNNHLGRHLFYNQRRIHSLSNTVKNDIANVCFMIFLCFSQVDLHRWSGAKMKSKFAHVKKSLQDGKGK